MILFMDKYINENYYLLKEDLVKYCKYNGLKFDEDIFHNTIIGCMDKVNDIDSFKNYLFISFKNNLNREKLYHRNLLRDELPNDYEVPTDNTESLIEYNNILRLLKNKFGEEMLELFNKHISGYSVRELELLYNCKLLTYKKKTIKNKKRSIFKYSSFFVFKTRFFELWLIYHPNEESVLNRLKMQISGYFIIYSNNTF